MGWGWGAVAGRFTADGPNVPPAMFRSVAKTLLCSSALVNCEMKSKRFRDNGGPINEEKKTTKKRRLDC